MPDEFVVQRQPMTCGSYEAEVREYKVVMGGSGRTWLVAIQPNAADNIYVSDPNPRSQGFAGRTLTFKIKEGGTPDGLIRLQGPWHSNSQSLLDDTGLDIRDQHLTFVVISEEREIRENYEQVMTKLLHIDSEPTIGLFDRGKLMAQEWAESLGKPVWCYMESQGGGSGPNLVYAKEGGADGKE